MRVAYQGGPGAFSESAARQALGDAIECLPCRTFIDVAEAVRSGTAERGVLPLSNRIAGVVTEARAALAAGGLEVMSEIELPIEPCLLVLSGGSLAAVRRVISHPVALAQCGRFLAAHPAIEAAPFWDTADAAREVAERRDPALAAIAGRAAADRYGLSVAVPGVGDRPDNATRFAIVGRGLSGRRAW
ncbi:MAG TPA: prephenate dehydratase domain-containing protein [Gemmatimonadales bacterium]|nr:prephenate dehydratase domain-containing protein [Gemmatimonadales bacterium]